MEKHKIQIQKILFFSLTSIIIIITITVYFLYSNRLSNKICITKEEPLLCGTKNYSITGKNIFNSNCAACHKLNGFDDIIKARYPRYKDSTYFENYIKNETSLVKNENKKYINKMFEGDFNHNFESLTKKEIFELKKYIEAYINY